MHLKEYNDTRLLESREIEEFSVIPGNENTKIDQILGDSRPREANPAGDPKRISRLVKIFHSHPWIRR